MGLGEKDGTIRDRRNGDGACGAPAQPELMDPNPNHPNPSPSPVCRAPNAEITADPVEKRTTEESKEIESGIVPGPLVQSDCTKS